MGSTWRRVGWALLAANAVAAASTSILLILSRPAVNEGARVA